MRSLAATIFVERIRDLAGYAARSGRQAHRKIAHGASPEARAAGLLIDPRIVGERSVAVQFLGSGGGAAFFLDESVRSVRPFMATLLRAVQRIKDENRRECASPYEYESVHTPAYNGPRQPIRIRPSLRTFAARNPARPTENASSPTGSIERYKRGTQKSRKSEASGFRLGSPQRFGNMAAQTAHNST